MALSQADDILGAVLEILETDGYDAVGLREVARRARVSLATIYKLFRTRDELIFAAVERWMAANSGAPVAPAPPDESLYDGLMRVFRHVFEPWERSPRMLEAYHRAASVPGGERLEQQSMATIGPAGRAVLDGGDPRYVEDVGVVLTNVAHAVVGRFAAGQLDVTDILPTLERAVFRLTADNAQAARAARVRRAGRGG